MVSVDGMQTRISLARSEARRLAEYLRELPSEDWRHSTACDRWQVADVTAHLVWIGEFYAIFIDRALADDLTPPPGSPKDEKYAGMPPEDFYALQAFQYRKSLADDLLPTFVRRFEELVQALEQLTPADYERPCFYHSGNRPVWTLADLTVQELAIHAWDIQSRLDPEAPDARLSPASQPVLLERVLSRPLPALPLAAATSQPARLRFELSGAVTRAYDLIPAPAASRLEPAGDATAAATLHCDTETFLLLLYRRLDLAAALSNGQLAAAGNTELAQAFAAEF